ncbi:MAG: TetR/AcrR family transcriptional regulator [Akkermansiaceae bacterium]|nr:TetR/AcrR family transcriptional regulator [Akkermansiaceae bacterium]MCP5550484.1 TetR/AcrR family transcriptional regulator [Akkermansiaceae bacterium]
MKKPNARERILETAARLFQERGFSEVGINEIIEKAETAKATFYQHFPSKDSLCEAWLEAIHRRSEEWLKKLRENGGSCREKAVQYFDFLEKFLEKNDFRGCPYSNTSAVTCEECGGIRRRIEEHKLAQRDFLRELAAEVSATGQRACDLGDTLFLLYSGATTEAQNLRAIWPIRAARQAAIDLLENEKSKNS